MPEREIDPALVKAWATEARTAINIFLEDLKDVEFTAESGFNTMTHAKARSATLRRHLQDLERKAERLEYRG